MLIVLACGLIMVALLDRAVRHERIVTARMKARFELFAIRDDLRRLCRMGEIPHNRWFSFMDTTLTKSIASVEVMTLWHMIAFVRVMDMRAVATAEENRDRAMERMPALAAIYARYARCVAQLIRGRHKLLWQILGILARFIATAARLRSSALRTLKGSPETSTLLEYGCYAN